MTSAYKLLQNENFRTIQLITAKNLIIQILFKTTHRKCVVCTCTIINRKTKIGLPSQVKGENVKFRCKIL